VAAEPLMDLSEIAEYLKVSERWVRREAPSYGVPLYRIGQAIRARRRELDEWLDQQRIRN